MNIISAFHLCRVCFTVKNVFTLFIITIPVCPFGIFEFLLWEWGIFQFSRLKTFMKLKTIFICRSGSLPIFILFKCLTLNSKKGLFLCSSRKCPYQFLWYYRNVFISIIYDTWFNLLAIVVCIELTGPWLSMMSSSGYMLHFQFNWI